MTTREFYTAIAGTETLSAELQMFAAGELSKMDAANAKRRAANAEKAADNAKYVEMLIGFVTDEPKTSTDLVQEFVAAGCATHGTGKAEKPMSPQFVTRLAKIAIEDGKIAKTEVKGEKGKRVAYIAC